MFKKILLMAKLLLFCIVSRTFGEMQVSPAHAHFSKKSALITLNGATIVGVNEIPSVPSLWDTVEGTIEI